MSTRTTNLGCKVTTTRVIQPNGQYTENVTLSVDNPHCDTHTQFEYDCVDCGDAISKLPRWRQ